MVLIQADTNSGKYYACRYYAGGYYSGGYYSGRYYAGRHRRTEDETSKHMQVLAAHLLPVTAVPYY